MRKTTPPAEAASDHPAFASGLQPLATVTADLMPDDVLERRQLGHLKRRIVAGGIGLVLILGAGYTLVRQQTSQAESDLHDANQRVAALNQQIGRFHELVTTQSTTLQLSALLTGAMNGDIAWATLLGSLQRVAPAGVQVTAVAGQTADSTTAAATPTSVSGPKVVGSMTISGTTRSYRAVADYAARLSTIHAFTAINPATTATSGTGGQLTFTVTLSLTKHALSVAQGSSTSAAATSAPTTLSDQSTSTPAATTKSASGSHHASKSQPASSKHHGSSTKHTSDTSAAKPDAAQLPIGN